MLEIGLLLWLAVGPDASSVQPVERVDACELAREIAARGPCLRAEDCGAYRDWKRLFGAPRTEPLDPQVAATATRSPRQLTAAFVCPATELSAARRPDPR